MSSPAGRGHQDAVQTSSYAEQLQRKLVNISGPTLSHKKITDYGTD
jgi:hypothetical protein